MTFHNIQPSFAAGELTPSLYGRVDMAKYNVGLKICENFIIHPHGGVSRRHGTRYIADAKGPCRLVDFIYNEDIAYVLEFGERYIRVIHGDRLLDVEIETPYTAEEVWELNFAQSADVMFIVHKGHAPMELARLGETNWTLTPCKFTPMPFKDQTDAEAKIMMTPDGKNGEVTVTASEDYFTEDMHGGAIQLFQHVDEFFLKETGNAIDHTEVKELDIECGVVDYVLRYYYSESTNEGESWSWKADSKPYLSLKKKDADRLRVGDTFICRGATHTITEIVPITEENSGDVAYGDGNTNPEPKPDVPANKFKPGHEGEYAVYGVTPNGKSSIFWHGGGTLTFTATHATDGEGDAWGEQVTVYKSWRFETGGFWSGTILLQRFDVNEARWITMKRYTSVESETSAKNYADSGEFDEPTQLRIVSEDFYTFVPEDNVEEDRGYALLVAEETDYAGWGTIAEVVSGAEIRVNVEDEFCALTGTMLWRISAWNKKNGYPRAVGFYQERLCFGGTIAEPQTVWLSKTGDYYNFSASTPTVDDDAITATMAARQVNVIRHFLGLGNLVVLTSGSEWLISADGAITPTNISAKPQGYRGCAILEPLVIGNVALFIQQQGYRVRDLGYAYDTDSYTGNDLTIMAEHMFRDHTVKDWCYQQEPDSMAWLAREDGALLSLTYLREHDVFAWARHPTDGTVESVAAVPGDYGTDVYLCAVRNGRRVIELMKPVNVKDARSAYYLDSGVLYDGEPTDAVNGLAHLAGKKVQVLADGSYLGEFTVSEDGTVKLPKRASAIRAGLGYQSKLRTLDLNASRGDGAQLTRKSRVAAVAIRVEQTRGLWAGTDERYLEENVDRTGEPYDAATGLKSCDIHLSLSSTYVDYGGGSVWVETKTPLPASVLAVVPEVSAGG